MKLDYSFQMIIFIIGNIHVLTNVYNVYFKNKCLLIYYCMPDYQLIITIALGAESKYQRWEQLFTKRFMYINIDSLYDF